jgi:GNAT superfamily N-acetyltransferase
MTNSDSDLALARRLERAEAAANAAFVEARARVDPSVGATWIEVAGAYAMFDGVHSPLTQTFGVGLFDPFGVPEFAAVEAFFDARGAATSHEICACATGDTTRLLSERGYVPIEWSTVLVRETRPSPAPPESGLTVRVIGPDEIARWAQVSALGWSSAGAEVSAFVEQLGTIMGQARGVKCFLAEQDGQPIAAAALNLSTDVALLAGASTIPSARGRGAQRALLQARLTHAAARGIELAMIVTQPESASQRNAERGGFRSVYARTKWQRSHPGS